jgi:hypothetical protein
MKKALIILFTAFAAFSFAQKNAAPGKVDHSKLDKLLKKYVSTNGKVDYKGLKKDKATLDAYTVELAKQIPDKQWSNNASLAYWINAYNAFTLKLIVDNYPVTSITKLYGGKPWDVKWIELAGKKYSLNNIENDIIRPTFKDARIHFAVNCAAVSCPPLSNIAFTEANINSLLTARTTAFLNSSANEISASKIKISKIFDWYKADFGVLTSFINKYSKTKANANAVIEFKEYDWSLNEQ